MRRSSTCAEINGTVVRGHRRRTPVAGRRTPHAAEAILALLGHHQRSPGRPGLRGAGAADRDRPGRPGRRTRASGSRSPTPRPGRCPSITSPEWSGSEARWPPLLARSPINTERLKPWHTLTGRQHFYLGPRLDGELGEQLPTFRPPLDMHGAVRRTRRSGSTVGDAASQLDHGART